MSPDAPRRSGAAAGAGPGGPPSAAFLLMALGRRVRTDVEEELRQSGLSLPHVSALGHLAGQPDLSYSELGRRAGVTAQSMQATLRRLEELGAVERSTPTGRGRTARLRLTPHGERLLIRGRDAITAADLRLLGALPADQRERLTGLLLQVLLATAPPAARPAAGEASP